MKGSDVHQLSVIVILCLLLVFGFLTLSLIVKLFFKWWYFKAISLICHLSAIAQDKTLCLFDTVQKVESLWKLAKAQTYPETLDTSHICSNLQRFITSDFVEHLWSIPTQFKQKPIEATHAFSRGAGLENWWWEWNWEEILKVDGGIFIIFEDFGENIQSSPNGVSYKYLWLFKNITTIFTWYYKFRTYKY